MSVLTGDVRGRRDSIEIPTLWVAVALSLLLHAAALLGWLPKFDLTPFEDPKSGKKTGTLAVRIAPPPSPQASAAPSSPPPPVHRAKPAPAAPPRPAPAARVITLESPSPAVTPPPAPAEPARPPAGDLASFIAARRRARGDPAPSAPPAPAETEQQRHNRIVAESLGLNRTPTFGTNPDRGGGVFQVRSMSLDYAEFAFFGWNKAVGRNTLQRLEVERGGNPTIEIAVVRRIIEVIRGQASGDFQWDSPRTGQMVTLSARVADTDELEAFLMRDFFPGARAR